MFIDISKALSAVLTKGELKDLMRELQQEKVSSSNSQRERGADDVRESAGEGEEIGQVVTVHRQQGCRLSMMRNGIMERLSNRNWGELLLRYIFGLQETE